MGCGCGYTHFAPEPLTAGARLLPQAWGSVPDPGPLWASLAPPLPVIQDRSGASKLAPHLAGVTLDLCLDPHPARPKGEGENLVSEAGVSPQPGPLLCPGLVWH